MGFPGDSHGKESACNAGDLGSVPESRSSFGEGKGNPLQYSCLDGQRSLSDMTEQLILSLPFSLHMTQKQQGSMAVGA